MDSKNPFHGTHYSMPVCFDISHEDIKGYGNVPRIIFSSQVHIVLLKVNAKQNLT